MDATRGAHGIHRRGRGTHVDSAQLAQAHMNAPDYGRVASVLVSIGLRLVTTVEVMPDADSRVLPGVDVGAGGRGLFDRGSGRQAPGVCGAA